MKRFKDLAEQYREEGRFKPVIPHNVKSTGVGPRPQVDSAKTKLKEDEQLDELSNELLGRYKTKSGEQASAADKVGDFKTGNKRFSGIIKATRKQFDNDGKNIKEDLRNWFDPDHPKGGWKRINSKGEAIGPCAREPGEAKPKCMSNEKRAALSKKERASAVSAKRRHDPDAERKGKPINVSNFGKGKLSEDMEQLDEKNVPTSPEKWAQAKAQAKAKFDVYPSAYANGWAAKKYKEMGGGWKSVNEETDTTEKTEMAQTQLHFMKYAAEEILEYIEMGGEVEEWYQNKLSKVMSDIESLHSYVEGESRRTGMKEEVEQIDEASKQKLMIGSKVTHPDHGKGTVVMHAQGGGTSGTIVKFAAGKKVKVDHKKLRMAEEVEQLEEGRPSQRHPLEGHEYHKKTNAELEYIAKDAHKAAEAMKGHNTTAENKYRDQANDSATVRYFRKKSGTPDWYKKKYGLKEEVEQLDEISDKTLQSYRSKAHTQIQHYKYAGGKDKPEASAVLAKREPGMASATAKVIQKSKERVAAQPKREPQKASSYKPLGGRDEKSGRSYSEEVEQTEKVNHLQESRRANIVREAMEAAKKKKKQQQEQSSDKFNADPTLSSEIVKT
jgi:hypothetical protein